MNSQPGSSKWMLFVYHINKFLLLLSLVLSVPLQASETESSSSPYFISGYDLVSYFRDSGPVPGNPQYLTQHNDKTLIFSSQRNRDDFILDPEAYLPAYDGYCAYGMVYGMKSKIDPLQYDIVKGRLYLQLDRGTKKRWNRRISRYIKKSDRAWRKVANDANG